MANKQPLTIKTNGIRGQVLKDGIDISDGIKAIHIDIVAGQLPEITFERADVELEVSINECLTKVKQPPRKMRLFKGFTILFCQGRRYK